MTLPVLSRIISMQHSKTRKLLGTLIEITIISDDTTAPDRIEYVFDYFWSIEQEFSRFRPDSSLSRLNRDKIAQVSSRFITLMKLCKQRYEETDGLFNPLVQVARLGYSHSFDDGNFEQIKSIADTDFSKVLIGTDRISIGEHQSLDFGGIAKGYAVDMAAAILLAFGYDNFFVNAGGDIYTHGMNNSGEPWVIGIENPFTLSIDTSLILKNTAIATSGRYKRNWNIEGRNYHHLVNPLS